MCMTRQQLIEDNMGLVHYVVRKFYPWRSDDEDIIQVGMIGLIKAADKWDAEKGSFSNFAIICIRGSIANEIKKQLKQIPTVSLDAILNNGDEKTSLLDLQIGSSDIDYVDTLPVYKILTHRERTIFDLLRDGMSQADIGRELGISRQRVEQAMRKIKLKWKKVMGE